MSAYADLEIGFHRRDVDNYTVELRFSTSGDDRDRILAQERIPLARFDKRRLQQFTLDNSAYGRALADSLFNNPNIKKGFAEARIAAHSQDIPLHLRLFIAPGSPELNDLRWETLRDPEDDRPLLTSEHILFSRYLFSSDWRRVHLRSKAALRALVVIANPTDLHDWKPIGRPLEPLDMAAELTRAEESLGNIFVKELASNGSANLNNLVTQLREGYDILYLVCHGALIEGESHLWLENEAGGYERIMGSELVNRLRELWEGPRLVVLASCQSGGSDSHSTDAGALAALGPRLAEAGVSAVLAMQGDITQKTVAQFMPRFFQELQRHGQIDRAMAVSRSAVQKRPDWWIPVLFMRLRSGRIWYAPGFTQEKWEPGKWTALCEKIRDGNCTPIIGHGLITSFLGPRREIAQRWAKTYNFPLAPHHREDLPQVAQYLAVDEGRGFPRDQLMKYVHEEMLKRYRSNLPEMLHGASLDELITEIGKRRREHDPAEPHKVLAELPLSVYITTNFSSLLADALEDAGKKPQVMVCRWNEEIMRLPSIYDDDPDYCPSEERPLVFHLFGHFKEPASLVLTEDDYFDFLINISQDKAKRPNKRRIPEIIWRRCTNSALLFLGHRLDDWSFRILFRSIQHKEGVGRSQNYTHVAAQVDPEAERILIPERARRYLESYFFQQAKINIFWGSPEDFVRELQDHYKGNFT